MGRFNVGIIRYMQKEHFRVLMSVEMGMKNHELVPLQLVASIAGIHRGAVARTLSDLQKHCLVIYEKSKRSDGFRLTNFGYDFLALKALCMRGIVGSVGNQIGVGKESDVFVGGDPELNDVVLKFHRLGRTSFRKLKEKRDYHRGRRTCSWLYLARLAAAKEYAFLKALHEHKFPVPRPLDVCRHTVVMGLIDGVTLCHAQSVDDPADLYDRLMTIIVRLGRYGLIHGDFNEFNIVLDKSGTPILIDFPQMVSIDHPNAEFYFNRDVECVRTFLRRRFNFESEMFPKFEDIERKYNLDVEVAASGFTKQMAKDLNAAYEAGQLEPEEGEQSSSGEEDANEGEEPEYNYDNAEIGYEQQTVAGNGATRLDVWLNDAREQLHELELFDDSECPQLLPADKGTPGGLDDEENCLENAQVKHTSADQAEGDSGTPEANAEFEEKSEADSEKAQPARSTYSIGSTISREGICKRISLEQRAKKKAKLRLKGKASAVRSGRKTNMAVIKEYSGWEF